MNNKFMIINDKAIVFDNQSNTRILDCTDNILEVLKQENNIETIEKLKKDVDEEIKSLNKICSRNKAWCFSPLIACTLALGIAYPVFNALGFDDVTNTIFGEMTKSSVAILSVGTPILSLAAGISLSSLSNRKKDEKELNALKTMKIYVDDKLIEEKENLEELKKHNKSVFKNSTYVDEELVIVEQDDDFYEEFNHQKNLYYDVGYQKKKYEKYLQKGNIDKKLCAYYTDDEISEVKEILKKLSI